MCETVQYQSPKIYLCVSQQHHAVAHPYTLSRIATHARMHARTFSVRWAAMRVMLMFHLLWRNKITVRHDSVHKPQ